MSAPATKPIDNLLSGSPAVGNAPNDFPVKTTKAAPDTPPSNDTTATERISGTSRRRVNVAVPAVLADPSQPDDIHLHEYEKLNDPMRNLTDELKGWNAVKLYAIGIVTLPVKIVLTAGILTVGVIIGKVAQFGMKKPKKNSGEFPKPLSKTRRTIAKGIYYLARLLLVNNGFYYIKVTGKPDPKATVIVCNHMGPFEATALLYFSQCTIVSRIENARIPLLGAILKSLQCIFVDRSNVTSREDTVAQINERAKAPPGLWPPLLIFPEGTTGNGKSMMRFRVGAFQPGLPVQPIVAKFPFRYLDPTWSGNNIGMGGLMLRVMSQFYNKMEIHFLPTYYPSDEEKADPFLYAENVRRYMSSKSGVPMSNYSLDDYMVMAEAHKYNIPQSEALLGMEMLRKESNIHTVDVKNIIRAFGVIDSSKTGKIRYGPFLRALNLPDTPITRGIFSEVMLTQEVDTPTDDHKKATNAASSSGGEKMEKTPDLDKAASDAKAPAFGALDDLDFSVSTSDNPNAKAITFRQFLKAIIRINKNMSAEDKIAQAFDIINFTGSGRITKDELVAIVEFASEEMSQSQAKELYSKMDHRRAGYVDRVDFGAFMRANPIYIAMFEASRRFEREKDLHNPVIQALEMREKGTPCTVPQFREMVKQYREQAMLGSGTFNSF